MAILVAPDQRSSIESIQEAHIIDMDLSRCDAQYWSCQGWIQCLAVSKRSANGGQKCQKIGEPGV